VHRAARGSLRTELTGGQASLPATKRESSPAAWGAAPRNEEEELWAAVMVANRQSLGLLQVYVACVWDVSDECLQVFHANVAKLNLDVAML
jgi:hypothetical protein